MGFTNGVYIFKKIFLKRGFLNGYEKKEFSIVVPQVRNRPTKHISKGKGPEAGISLVHSRKNQKEASMSVECQPRKKILGH